MKILSVTPFFPLPGLEYFGIFVRQQMVALRAVGVEVQVVAPVPLSPFPISLLTPRWRVFARTPATSVVDGVVVRRPRFLAFPRYILFSTYEARMAPAVERAAAQARRDFPFEVVHAHAAFPAGNAALRLKATYGVPVVVTVHGYDLYDLLRRGPVFREAAGRAFAGADRIVFVSERLRKLYLREFGESDKLEVVGNGVESGQAPARWNMAESHGVAGPMVVSVAVLVPRKGLEFVVRAIARIVAEFPGLLLLVIGDGPSRRSLEREVAALGLKRHVRFMGAVDHATVLRYMAGADLFCLPSWDEGFGVVYIEALSVGTPVIACRGEGIDGIVRDGRHGLLVPPRDECALAAALRDLLGNPARARAMGERGRTELATRYTWSANARRMVEIFSSLGGTPSLA